MSKARQRALNKNSWLTKQIDGLTLNQSPLLAKQKSLVHAFTTRLGGNSPAPVDTFNLGRHLDCDESKADAANNRRRLCQALGLDSQRLAVPEALLNLAELDVLYDGDARALWTYMRHTERPNYTPALLADFEQWQSLIARHFGPSQKGQGRVPLDFLIVGSRAPGVFCFGGDLDMLEGLIRSGNREGLADWGYRCVEILDRNMAALNLPMVTIGLVQGQALGGGFEALLSFDMIIAERGSTFGLPEVAFGLFPGMGAHSILARRLGSAKASQMIRQGQTYAAEELYELGLVTVLAPEGEGVAAVRTFIAKNARKLNGLVGERRAMRLATPIPLAEMRAIVDVWADTAMGLSSADLKLMQRLAGTQLRRKAA